MRGLHSSLRFTQLHGVSGPAKWPAPPGAKPQISGRQCLGRFSDGALRLLQPSYEHSPTAHELASTHLMNLLYAEGTAGQHCASRSAAPSRRTSACGTHAASPARDKWNAFQQPRLFSTVPRKRLQLSGSTSALGHSQAKLAGTEVAAQSNGQHSSSGRKPSPVRRPPRCWGWRLHAYTAGTCAAPPHTPPRMTAAGWRR